MSASNTATSGDRVAVIGGGVSGVGAADALRRLRYTPVVFEKGARAGGQWLGAYKGARLQNTSEGYEFVRFFWQDAGLLPDRHPTREQVLEYVDAAVREFRLDLRLETEVVRLGESCDAARPGWTVVTRPASGRAAGGDCSAAEESSSFFYYVVIATGHFSEKVRPAFPGEDRFRGQVVTSLNLDTHALFSGATKRGVVVVGMGKTALDLAVFAARARAPCTLVFRKARWLIPDYVLGVVSYSSLFFWRVGGSLMVPCWDQPDAIQRCLHSSLAFAVAGFWALIAALFTASHRLAARRGMPEGKKPTAVADAHARLRLLQPDHALCHDLRSAFALAPDSFHSDVARGAVVPHLGEIASFSDHGVTLDDGTEVLCDVVALGTGSGAATVPFLPKYYARIIREGQGGLYRHVIHPDIPRVAWAGMNHGFSHMSAIELGILWTAASWRGEIVLPSSAEMHASMVRVLAWKTAHAAPEPSRPYNVNTRFQAYSDTLARELGISVYRKLPNLAAELFLRSVPADYHSAISEYQVSRRANDGSSLPSLPIDM